MKIIRIASKFKSKFEKSLFPAIPLHQKGGWEEGRQREQILIEAIKKLAEEWNIGPIDYIGGIDSRGDIKMVQKMRSVLDYENPNEIDSDLVEIAREYNNDASGSGYGINGRWIRLNHFAWEKMLGDMGLLPRKEVADDEFIKEIRK